MKEQCACRNQVYFSVVMVQRDSRLRSAHGVRGRSLSVPLEDSFAFQIPLALPFFSSLWVAGKRLPQRQRSPRHEGSR